MVKAMTGEYKNSCSASFKQVLELTKLKRDTYNRIRSDIGGDNWFEAITKVKQVNKNRWCRVGFFKVIDSNKSFKLN